MFDNLIFSDKFGFIHETVFSYTYYNTATVTAEKSFMVQAPGGGTFLIGLIRLSNKLDLSSFHQLSFLSTNTNGFTMSGERYN